ncbi:MAG: hypothetical protein K2X66_17005 [Cyanobacteria bacterium]|nr:hypothetical protein [Cyanobacteriota bacterium]
MVPGAFAQQTVFNVPSADITPEKKIFLQHESQFRPWQPGGFWLGTHYASYGIGHHTEIDTTLYNVSKPASKNITLGIGFKTAFPLFEKRFPERELKLTIGQMLPISLEGKGVGNWSYGTLSGRLPKLKTRLTAGYSTGTKQIFGRTPVGFIGAVEQPLTQRLSLITDWYSGTHGNGFLITGLSYAFPQDISLYAGFQIPNTNRSGKSGFVLELAKLF